MSDSYAQKVAMNYSIVTISFGEAQSGIVFLLTIQAHPARVLALISGLIDLNQLLAVLQCGARRLLPH